MTKQYGDGRPFQGSGDDLNDESYQPYQQQHPAGGYAYDMDAPHGSYGGGPPQDNYTHAAQQYSPMQPPYGQHPGHPAFGPTSYGAQEGHTVPTSANPYAEANP